MAKKIGIKIIMNNLDKYETQLKPVSDDDFHKAQEKLLVNMKQKSFYREQQFLVFENGTVSSSFANENLRRSYYKNAKFEGADLTNVGFSGSVFAHTGFFDCTISNTKLDFCEFDDCVFQSSSETELNHLNLNESTVCNGKFINLNLHGANFTNTIFENVEFEDCTWKSPCLEGAVFRNTTLNNVTLKKLNFEFSFFDNIKLNNVRLPFPTIPYIFNGLSYLMHTSDSVKISSAASESGSISIDEYLNYIDDLIAFYTKTQNYFPLANILIAKEEYEQAYAAILAGIKFSMMKIRNFRLVYYYSKLLQITPVFSAEQRAIAYHKIIDFSGSIDWRPIDYYNFSHYIDKIRNTLLNEKNGDFLTVNLSTNILCTEYDKLLCLYETIDDITRLIEKEKGTKITYYTEIRHNSPYDFFIKVFSEPDVLSLLLDIITIVCSGIGAILFGRKEKKKLEERESKKVSILQNIDEKLEIGQLNSQIQQQQQMLQQYGNIIQQYEKILMQNEMLCQKIDNLCSIMDKNNIAIDNINYYLSNTNQKDAS